MAGELILIVEDNERNLKLLRDLLGAHGYRDARGAVGRGGARAVHARSALSWF